MNDVARICEYILSKPGAGDEVANLLHLAFKMKVTTFEETAPETTSEEATAEETTLEQTTVEETPPDATVD